MLSTPTSCLLQIGVIGWITPTTGETSRDVGGVKFTPIVPSVQACLSQLKQEQPDLDFIIGLSHSGGGGGWPQQKAVASTAL